MAWHVSKLGRQSSTRIPSTPRLADKTAAWRTVPHSWTASALRWMLSSTRPRWIFPCRQIGPHATRPRSEEHTSELQSQSNLVCRLLLEKKKQQVYTTGRTGDDRDDRVVSAALDDATSAPAQQADFVLNIPHDSQRPFDWP